MCFLRKYYKFPFQELPDDEFIEINTNKENKDHTMHEEHNFNNVFCAINDDSDEKYDNNYYNVIRYI